MQFYLTVVPRSIGQIQSVDSKRTKCMSLTSFIYSFIQSDGKSSNILCLALGTGSAFNELLDSGMIKILILVHVHFQFS